MYLVYFFGDLKQEKQSALFKKITNIPDIHIVKLKKSYKYKMILCAH